MKQKYNKEYIVRKKFSKRQKNKKYKNRAISSNYNQWKKYLFLKYQNLLIKIKNRKHQTVFNP